MARTEDMTKSWHLRAQEDLEAKRAELAGDSYPPPEAGSELHKLIEDMEEEARNNMRAYTPNEKLNELVLRLYVVVQGILGVLAIVLMIWAEPVMGINVGLLILVLQGAHLAASFRTVGVDQLAGITFFGRPTAAPGPGLVFVPWLLMQLHHVSRNYKDQRFPGPADKVLRVSTKQQEDRSYGDAPSPDDSTLGYVRPIIVVSGTPRLNDDEKKAREGNLDVDPFDERTTFEVAYVIRYRANEKFGGIFRIIRNIGVATRETTLETLMADHLRENSERDLKALIARHTLATMIENKKLFNEVFALQIQRSVIRLGIDIDINGTGVDDENPSHKTNEALAAARRARFERTQVIIAADAEREKRIREGEGTARAEQALLKARAAGLKQIIADTGASGEAVLASETARNFPSTDRTVFGAQGIKEILSIPGLLPPSKPKAGEEEPKKEGE